MQMSAYVITVCVLARLLTLGGGHLLSRDSRGRGQGRGVGGVGYCELAVTCRGHVDDNSGSVNVSSPVRLPIRGRRGKTGPPGRKGDRGLPGPPGKLTTFSQIYTYSGVFRIYTAGPRESREFFAWLFTARCYTERGYATVCRLSVCPSCPSVTFRYRCQALHIFHTVSSGVAYDLRAPGYI